MTTQPKKKRKRQWLRDLLAAVGLLLPLLGLWYWMGVYNYQSFGEKTEEASRFGESFGYVNSLFSGLALVGIIIAILLQRADLKLTRRELRKSANAHQEFVKLSALSTLLQTYLEEYQLNTERHDAEFKELLRHDSERAKTHIWFRILVLRAEIEAINAKAAGKKVDGVSVTVADQRRRLWINDLLFAAGVFGKRWAEFKAAPGRFPAMQGWEAITAFVERLEALEKWIEAVPSEYHNPLQLLRNSLHGFGINVDPRPFPPHDAGGGTSNGPPLHPLHHETGDALFNRAMMLADAIRSGRHFSEAGA
jgi:hypothetical protein